MNSVRAENEQENFQMNFPRAENEFRKLLNELFLGEKHDRKSFQMNFFKNNNF